MCAAVRMSCFFSKREVLRVTFNKSIQLKCVFVIEIYDVGNSGGGENARLFRTDVVSCLVITKAS